MVYNLLRNYGNRKIVNLWIGRSEVNTLIQAALGAMSGADFQNGQTQFTTFKNKQLDPKWEGKIYHAFMVFQLDDGSWHFMEKNQQIAVKSNFLPKGAKIEHAEKIFEEDKMDMMRVDNKHLKGKTLKQIMKELEMRALCLYYYTAWEYNCQYFVHSFLLAAVDNEKMQAYDDFFYQPVMKKFFTIKEHGALAKIVSKMLTDIAALTENRFANLLNVFMTVIGGKKARVDMDDYYYDYDYMYDDDDDYDDDDYDEMDWKEYMFLQGYLAGIEDGKKGNH